MNEFLQVLSLSCMFAAFITIIVMVLRNRGVEERDLRMYFTIGAVAWFVFVCSVLFAPVPF